MYNASTSCAAYTGKISNSCPSSLLLLFTSIIANFIQNNHGRRQFCDGPTRSDGYDFIVVGGGTAGAVVASRLSETAGWSVLLVEAGPEEPLDALMPSMVGSYIRSELDWGYRTANESNGCLAKGGSCYWPRGKNLGGSSVHNGMMYIRGHARDYDDWKIPGWSWEQVLPYYVYSEDNGDLANSSYHGRGGLLPVERFSWHPAIARDILKAVREAGHPLNSDLNGERILGFGLAQMANRNGLRFSSASAFLRPARNRSNLQVLLNATVTQVLIEAGQARGVKYFKDGEYKVALAKREVVVSGGAVGSPHLLLLSGIGPGEQLTRKKVKVVKYLAGVGENLQNHVSFELGFIANDNDTRLTQAIVDEYIKNRTGPLASTGLAQLTGILATNDTTPDHPDLQFYFSGHRTSCSEKTEDPSKTYISIKPVYLHPESRGSLRLASNDPFEPPLITQNYLTRERDVKGLIEGIRIGLGLAETKALAKYNLTLVTEPTAACKEFEFKSDKYWRCAIGQNTLPENHQAGSCKMGRAGDPYAVVDNRLKVYGIKGLRVADTSIMPKLISGNTAASAMMIGERAAAFIKEEYKST